MYSKARIAGHPIHPMLIAFPVALYVSTFVGLLVAAATRDPFWYRAAFWTNLAGVVMAAVAAVPGLVDLINIPDRTKARATGYKHAAFNVVALALFVISVIVIGKNWYGRQLNINGGYTLDIGTPIVLTALGVLSTVAAGWFGWTLVQTHHVGVKPTQQPSSALPMEDVDDLDEIVVPPATLGARPIEVRH